MKIYIKTAIAIFFLITSSYSQDSGILNWTFQLENPSSGGHNVGVLPNGNIIFIDADEYWSVSDLQNLGKIKCLNPQGNLVWEWQSPYINPQSWVWPIISSIGNIYFIADSVWQSGETSTSSQSYLYQLSSEGAFINKMISPQGMGNLSLDGDDNLYCSSYNPVKISKYDSNLQLLWDSEIAVPSGGLTRPTIAPDGTVYTGYSYSESSNYQGKLVSISNNGIVNWEILLGGYIRSNTVSIDMDGNLIVLSSPSTPSWTVEMRKYDINGNLLWFVSDTPDMDHKPPVIDSENNIYRTIKYPGGSLTHGFHLKKYNADGEIMWSKNFESQGFGFAEMLLLNNNQLMLKYWGDLSKHIESYDTGTGDSVWDYNPSIYMYKSISMDKAGNLYTIGNTDIISLGISTGELAYSTWPQSSQNSRNTNSLFHYPPASISTFTWSQVTDHIELDWSGYSPTEGSSVFLYKNTNPSFEPTIHDTLCTITSNATSYSDYDLEIDSTYYYKIRVLSNNLLSRSTLATNTDLKLYISVEGSDANDGSYASPFLTIQAGIDAAANGDTVIVEPGTYYENINFNGKNIVVGSLFLTTQDTSYISSTIIDGGAAGSVVIFGSQEDSTTVFSGFSLTNGNAVNGGAIDCIASSPTIEHMKIYSNQATYGGAIRFTDHSRAKLLSSKIFSNYATNGAGAIFCDNYATTLISSSFFGSNPRYGTIASSHFASTTIENCLFVDERNGPSDGYSSQINSYRATTKIINCTIVNTTNYGEGYAVSANDGTIEVVNSIVWDYGSWGEGQVVQVVGTGNVTVRNSDITNYTEGENSISVDPQFNDHDNNDFTLSDYSPCIGAGLDTNMIPLYDINNNQRPNPEGSNPDLGAYENTLATPLEGYIWSIQVQAIQGIYNDLDNYLGVSGNASNLFDNNFDVVEPPPAPGNSIRLSFPHPEWNSQLGNYFSTDVRPDVDLSDSLQIWDFEVLSTGDGVAAITLLLENASTVWPFHLVTNESLLSSEYNNDSTAYTFTFNSITDTHHAFSLVVGDTTELGITTITSPKADGYYTLGDTIPVEVIFSENVLVTGVPTLMLETGVVDAIVDYSHGSGSTTLTFDYVVAPDEMSVDLNYHSVSALELNGGTIMDASGEVAILTLPELWGSNSLGGIKNIRIDTQSPSIEHSGEMDGPKIVAANSSHVISWTMSSDVSNVGVYFSPDSGQTYSLLNSLDGGITSWQWQVPDSNLIFGGKLKFVADDSAGNASDAYSQYVFSIVGDSLSSSVEEGWTLWGAPLNPTVDTMEVNLSDDFSGYWTTYDYVNYGYTYDGFLQQGEGYWLGTIENTEVDVLGTPSTNDMEIPLSLGWDLLSNPLILDVYTDSLFIINTSTQDTMLYPDAVNAGLVNSIYKYDGNGYSEPSILQPWKGYWFSVLSDNLIVKFPVHRHDQVVARDIREEGWNLQLFATTENGAEDNLLTIGTHPEATDAFDAGYDEVRPPTVPGPRNVQLEILHPEWELPLGNSFVRDIRSENIDDLNEDWLITASSSETNITLTWDYSQVPDPLEIGIDISGDDFFVDLTEIESLTIAAGTEFTVRVGANALSVDNMALPTEYLLVQNYPNPFNPSTTIKYGLPERSDVSLVIYDLKGAEINRLVNQSQEAGWYNYNWMGADSYGKAVASGMYLARLEAGSFSQTIKMVYLR